MSAKVKYYINVAVVLILMLGFGFLPPIDPITPMGMKLIGVFAGCLWGWIVVGNLVWPSILGLVALGTVAGYSTVPKIISSVFANQTLILIIALLMFAGVINASGLSENISHKLITAKVTKGRPWVLTIMIVLASFLTSMFVSGIAGSIICFEFVYSISKQVGYKPKDTWPAMTLAGIVFAACVGGAVLPYKQGVVACYGFLSGVDPSLTYQFNEYFIFAAIFCSAVMVLYLLGCRFILRPDMEPLKSEALQLREVPPMDAKKKFTSFLLVLLVAILLVPSFLPKSWAVVSLLNGIGTSGLVFLVVALAVLVKDKEGKSFITMKEIAPSISWDIILMVGTALVVGPALAGPDTGVAVVFTNILMPFASGDNGGYLFSFVLLMIILVGTNFINNAVVDAILIPVVASIYMTVGVNPISLVAMISIVSNVAMLVPSASPMGAILAGSKDWISQKQIIINSLIGMGATAIVVLVGIPLGNMIFTF